MNIRSYRPGRIITIIVLTMISSFSYSKQIYNMADLEILRAEKNYREFFAHARDLKPRDRNQHWREMVRSMAVEFIDQQMKYRNLKKDKLKLIEGLATWPVLKSDEFFQIKRNRYQVTVLKHCVLDRPFDECYQTISQFWPKSNRDPETGYRITELLYSVRPKMDLWSILRDVVSHPLSRYYCHRDIVAEKMIQHYFLEIDEKWPNKNITQKLNLELHGDCWAKVAPKLKDFIFNGPTYYRNLVYRMLSSKNAIDQTMEDRFLTLYLLDNPSPGYVFNRAWNTLKSLADDPIRRQSIMAFLQKRDPLPGAIFASSDQTLKDNIIKLFNENFSEYLSHYAKTCLSYLQGIRTYPNGNPTIQCDDFFASNKKENWVGQTLQMKYSGIKK